jgi:hypothetical protein
LENVIQKGISNYWDAILYGKLKEGEIHINPKTVTTEIIPFKLEDLE